MLLAACGPPAQPPAPPAQHAQHAPTAAPVRAQTAEIAPAAATAAPSVTPLLSGKLLREVWPVAADGQPAVTALLYSSIAPSNDEYRSRTNVFWRADLNNLNNRQKIAEITSDQGLDVPIFGQLSPDGIHIAYLMPVGEGLGDLHIIHIDGSSDQRIITNIARTGEMCHRSFIWSPNSTQIAFIQSANPKKTYVDQLYTYDLGTHTTSTPLLLGWAFLVSWQTPQGILAITSSAQGQPRVLDAINPVSKERQAVATLPAQGFYCSNPAPDGQRILLDLDTGSYVFTINTKAFQKMTATASGAVWNPDSATVLDIGYKAQSNGRISKITRDPLSVESVTLGDDTPPVRQGLLSASPDGRYLVTCEARQIETRSSLFRTMLYDVANDRWQPLHDGGGCLRILGWQ